jgi:plastocyanin
MREMLSRRWQRLVLCSAVLVLASGAIGAGSILARTNTPAMAGMPMASMAGMPMAQPAAARGATGTVVRLHQKVVRVSIHNFAFGPARLEVSRGTRIIWTNTDGDPHTVTSDKGLWASDALDTGTQFARVFTKAGTFPYHCSIHPFMHGTIIVKK